MAKSYRAELTGVFGDPVDDNPTGVMMEAAYANKGLNYRYLTLRVAEDGFEDAMRSLTALNMKGINLTMPYKLKVLPWLSEMSDTARIVGAVNTVLVREDGKLYGDNTDGRGFVQALRASGSEVAGKNITILGAGGAARAIAAESALQGASSITIINRSFDRAKDLAETIHANVPDMPVAALELEPEMTIPDGCDILVNATSVGFAPDSSARPDINYDSVTEDMTVSDVVFAPADTAFLQECRRHGARTVNGLGMLACQGALNFTIWTGQDAPLDLMEETLRRELEKV